MHHEISISFKDSSPAFSDVKKLVGTPGYQAPEFLRSASAAGPKCDVYSFGVTVWSAVAKALPFEKVHPQTVIFKVHNRISS